MWRTLPPKNSSSSPSVMSNVRLPTKAVNGGSVGKGRSSRGGPRSARIEIDMGMERSTEGWDTHGGRIGSHRDRGCRLEPALRRSSSQLRDDMRVPNIPTGQSDSRAVGRESISSAHDPRAAHCTRSAKPYIGT